MSGLRPLDSSTIRMLQKFTSGMSFLGHRNVCLLGGVAILVCALAILVVPSWLSASEKSTERSQNASTDDPLKKCQLANGRIVSQQMLLDEKLILKFLTDPRTPQLILEGRRKRHEFALNIFPEVQKFGKDHPNKLEVQEYVKEFEIYCHPLPYEEVLIPFLSLGVANTTGIDDPATVKAIQGFQVRIFKYWLSLYHLGTRDEQLINDLLSFCKTSTLDLFSKVIGPMLEQRLKQSADMDFEFDYEDLIFYFIEPDCFVDGVWSPDEASSSGEEELIAGFDREKVREAAQQIIAPQLERFFDEQENKKTSGQKLVEEFKNNLRIRHPTDKLDKEVMRDHHSKDAILGLFLEIAES